MAEITTHMFLSKDIKKIIKCNKSITLFSLGPDVFYFSKKTKKLAQIMHRKNTLLFFKNYIKYIKDNNLENDEYIVADNESIDLKEIAISDLLLQLPSKILCDEDCKGLCFSCGCNLNESQCDCFSS